MGKTSQRNSSHCDYHFCHCDSSCSHCAYRSVPSP
jgi:hypothetical protein